MISKKQIAIATATFTSVLALGTIAALAQGRPAQPPIMEEKGPCHCSNPVNMTIVHNKSTGATPEAADFKTFLTSRPLSGYSSTAVDQHFADTIKWTLPTKTCEVTGTVSFTVKNAAGNGLQNNDSGGVIDNGVSVAGQSGPILLPNLNDTKTITYPLTPAQIKAGKVSVAVQDDTQVNNMTVTLTGCCIKPI